jgi:hypothetical protein
MNYTDFNQMETKENRSPAEIATMVHDHCLSANQVGRNGGPLLPPETLTLDEYIRFLKHYLNVEELLPDSLLEYKLQLIDQDSHLKTHFPNNAMVKEEFVEQVECCLGLIPVDSYGSALENRNILRELMIAKNGRYHDKNFDGFIPELSSLQLILPEEVRNAGSFVIPKYEDNTSMMPTKTDRENLKKLYSEAYKKLQELLNQKFRECDYKKPEIH